MRRRRWRRGGPSQQGPERLRLTSMMDILTVLLLFLLKSFVVEGEVVTPVPGVELPSSSADTAPEASLVIAISDDAILLGNESITTIGAVLARNDLLIPELDERLDAAYRQIAEIALRRGEEVPEGKITIQGDRAMEFRLLQRVMYTCSFSGFEEVSLAVLQES